jgi:alcohol dehydrogenase class IV
MQFEFATAARIIFGPGTLCMIGDLAKTLGNRALVISGQNTSRAQPLWDILVQAKIESVSFIVPHEPTTDIITLGTNLARQQNCDFVIGFGGGSVIDAAKAISALLTNGGEPLDYLEVIGQGKPLTQLAAPCIAVPTTAGTGTEVTKNAVLLSPEHKVKVSLRSPMILPRVALVDSLLTHTMPADITASTGLDAFAQVIEPYVSHMANPLTDAICREGIRRVGYALRRVFQNGRDAQARDDMALVSLCGGLALANAKLGAVHGFAGVLGGMFQAPHGTLCGKLLPFVMEANIKAMERQDKQNPALTRYADIANLLCQTYSGTPQESVEWVRKLVIDLQVPGLSSFGIRPEHFPSIIANTLRSSSMRGNPVQLSESELGTILSQAL